MPIPTPIGIKDGAGVAVTVNAPLNAGRAAAAESRPVVLATEDKAALDAVATQTTLAAVLAKLTADPATQTTLAAILAKLVAGPATEATSAAILAKLIAAPSTEATLAAVLAKIIAAPATEATLASVDGKTPALGQALAAASVPVILPAATVTALTPPAAIAGFATAANQTTELASLASIDGKAPALGQALAAASVPVVLTAAQITTLTPPAAIAGFATETTLAAAAASLAVLDDWDESDRAKVNPIAGQVGVAAGAGVVGATVQRTTLASDDPAVTVLGAVADAAVTGGATGSISAKLRSLSRDLVALIAQIPATLGIKTAAASLSVAPASDAVFVSTPAIPTLTSISGTITSGGSAQNAVASNAARKGYLLQNQSNASLWFNTLAAAIQGQPSLELKAGQSYETPPGGQGTGAISIIGSTTGQAFAAREW